jgi:hypothetical protein
MTKGWVDQRLDMFFHDEIRKSVVFVGQRVVDPETGVRVQKPIATAVLVAVPASNDNYDEALVYVVTARHVITRPGLNAELFLRLNAKNGEVHDYHTPPKRWFLSDTSDIFVRLGSDVLLIGLFTGYFGTTKSEPVLRFGRVSLLPQDGIEIEIDRQTITKVRAMLVESLSWGGESGSPVITGFDISPEVPGHIIGIVHGHYNISRDVEFSGDVLGSGRVGLNAGMAVVTPSTEIRRLLNREDVVEHREEALKKLSGKIKTAPEADVHDPVSEYERFEDLTRKLINVPKQEIDEKRKETEGA